MSSEVPLTYGVVAESCSDGGGLRGHLKVDCV